MDLLYGHISRPVRQNLRHQLIYLMDLFYTAHLHAHLHRRIPHFKTYFGGFLLLGFVFKILLIFYFNIIEIKLLKNNNARTTDYIWNLSFATLDVGYLLRPSNNEHSRCSQRLRNIFLQQPASKIRIISTIDQVYSC